MNLLINPPEMVQMGYTPPPLGLLYLAANDPHTQILDLALKPSATLSDDLWRQVEVVGVPMLTPTRHDALRILRLSKAAGKITVAGGSHTSVMTKQLLENYPFVDFWVCGDGEMAWRDLCRGIYPSQKVIKNPIDRLDTLPLPAWERINIDDYPARGSGVHRGNDLSRVPRVSIVLGRGCSGACTLLFDMVGEWNLQSSLEGMDGSRVGFAVEPGREASGLALPGSTASTWKPPSVLRRQAVTK